MSNTLLRRGLKLGHLRLLTELERLGQLGMAAEQMGIGQPAASRLLAEVERITGQPIRQRTGRGLTLTPQGQALARRARRALLEIDAAERELLDIGSGLSGHVSIGSVTGPALELVLPAVRTMRLAAPDVTVEVDVAPSDALALRLLSGQIDLALARVPDGFDASLFDFQPLEVEPVVLLVRNEHPLLAVSKLRPEMLLDYDWVMSGPGSILRRVVENKWAELSLTPPRVQLATTSFLLTLALIQQSNSIAPLALAVARQFAGTGPYVTLPIELGIEVQPYGIVTRTGTVLTPAVERIRSFILESTRQA